MNSSSRQKTRQAACQVEKKKRNLLFLFGFTIMQSPQFSVPYIIIQVVNIWYNAFPRDCQSLFMFYCFWLKNQSKSVEIEVAVICTKKERWGEIKKNGQGTVNGNAVNGNEIECESENFAFVIEKVPRKNIVGKARRYLWFMSRQKKWISNVWVREPPDANRKTVNKN